MCFVAHSRHKTHHLLLSKWGGVSCLQGEVSSRFSLCRQKRQRTKRATGVERGAFAPHSTPVALFYMGGVACQADAADRQATSTCKGVACQADVEDRQKPISVRGFDYCGAVTFAKPVQTEKSG